MHKSRIFLVSACVRDTKQGPDHILMASHSPCNWLIVCAAVFAALLARTNCIDIYKEWIVSLDSTINPLSSPQPVCTENYCQSRQLYM